jgi:hypothetical protein
VKFQPFIEGESIILITDHAALQWARIYENTNRRLAAWGAVFAAYPNLKIVHRPGKIHSNVDPISRLPRIPPHSSLTSDSNVSIEQDEESRRRAERQELHYSSTPALKAAFFSWTEFIDGKEAKVLAATTRAQKRKELEVEEETLANPERTWADPSPLPPGPEPLKLEDADNKEFRADDSPSYGHPLTRMSEELILQFVEGYEEDPYCKDRYNLDKARNPNVPLTPSHFEKADSGLLYFVDANVNSRVCVPRSLVGTVLKWIHEPPYESAHAGVERFTHQVQ